MLTHFSNFYFQQNKNNLELLIQLDNTNVHQYDIINIRNEFTVTVHLYYKILLYHIIDNCNCLAIYLFLNNYIINTCIT